MRRNPAPSFAALSCVLVTTLVLGVFIPVVQATNGAANSIRGRVVVDVDLNTTATPAETTRVRHEVEAARYVGHVELVSKQTGYEQERKIDPQAFQLIGYNPLPNILRVTPSNPSDADALRAELDQSSPVGTRLVTDPAIADVQNRQAQTDKILSATRIVKITMALLAALLIFSSMLLISNTIRLSLFSRRREVEVMKLVGATDWFIRWPFVLGGPLPGGARGLVRDRPARPGQAHPDRPAGLHRQADLPTGDDRLPAPDRDPDGLRHSCLSRGFRHIAAALPARLNP